MDMMNLEGLEGMLEVLERKFNDQIAKEADQEKRELLRRAHEREKENLTREYGEMKKLLDEMSDWGWGLDIAGTTDVLLLMVLRELRKIRRILKK
jgi:hypothetical protein